MPSYSLSRVEADALLRRTREIVTRGWADTAELLAHLGEIEARGLYRADSYDSFFAWCMGELHFSENAAYRRMRAARAARKFPVLFAAVADGRLNLTAILLLGPVLTPENANEWVAEATHKSRLEIELLLARRYPKPDVPTEVRPLAAPLAETSSATAAPSAGVLTLEPVNASSRQLSPAPVAVPDSGPISVAVGPPGPSAVTARVTPLAPERFSLKGTMDQETHELLQRARALLGHTVPSGDEMQVLKRVLQDWVPAMERRKHGLTDKPRPRRSSGDGRYIPAQVKREVFKRDGGRCTFVGTNGRRCESKTRLEYDHVKSVARGGRTCTDNLRLRCRAHNQYEAEQVFGQNFMREKREAASLSTPPATSSAMRALRGTRGASSSA